MEYFLHDMELLCEMLTNAGYVLEIIHVDNELDYTKKLNRLNKLKLFEHNTTNRISISIDDLDFVYSCQPS